MKDILTVKVLGLAQLQLLTFSWGYNALPGQAVHKLSDTQLADRGLSHAGIWVESFLLGHPPSHSPSYAVVYCRKKKRFIFALIFIPNICTVF